MNIEEIKGPDGDSVTIWKPSIRTHPTHEGEKTRDETRLWKGGKVNTHLDLLTRHLAGNFNKQPSYIRRIHEFA